MFGVHLLRNVGRVCGFVGGAWLDPLGSSQEEEEAADPLGQGQGEKEEEEEEKEEEEEGQGQEEGS